MVSLFTTFTAIQYEFCLSALLPLKAKKTSSIREIRRDQLSRAAFEAVARYGLRRTTFEKVGELAGVSKGVVLHHFPDKTVLLEAVFRRSNSLLSETLVELYRHATTPCERLWAIVIANFFETIFNQRVCQAWVSLASEIPHSAQCQRIQSACNARIDSNLRHALKHFLSTEDAHHAARQLGLLIDGIWVRGGLQSGALSSKAAIDEMEFALLKLLPSDEGSVRQHRQARKKIEKVAGIALGSRAYQDRVLQL